MQILETLALWGLKSGRKRQEKHRMVTVTPIISKSIQTNDYSPHLPAIFISWACLYQCAHFGAWNRRSGVHSILQLICGQSRTLRWLFSVTWSDLSFRTAAQPPRLRIWLQSTCCACAMVSTHGQVTPPSGLHCCSGLLVGPLHSFLLTYCYC